jgi:hypothetical protein
MTSSFCSPALGACGGGWHAWIMSRVAGKFVTQLATERLWRPMGAEQDDPSG